MSAVEVSSELEDHARRVDAALAAVAQLDGAARDAAIELKEAIEQFHRPALVHIVRTLRDDPRGKELLFALVDDPSVHAVLALHGIVRASVVTRAQAALDRVRPYLHSHGGDVELVDVDGGVARVRLHGSCSGCSMSAVTLRETVAQALVDGVDEITAIDVLEDQPTAAFIPLSAVGRKEQREQTGWVAGPAAAEVPLGGMLRFDVGDDSFIVTNTDQRLAVFRNECAHQGRSLDGGVIDERVLVCPWHGFRYDAASGECLSAPGVQLAQVPLRVDDGQVWIRAR